MTDRQSTHGHDCWGWGPKHYECAVREIKAQQAEIDQLREQLRLALRDAALAAQQPGGSDVKLLPLPELPRQVEGYNSDYWEAGQIEEYAADYARANVAHATAALQAEIEALRAEVERLNRLLGRIVEGGRRHRPGAREG